MQYYIDLNMGEGISGPDNVGAATSVLYSCIGIAFTNQSRQIGGLYHYPAFTSNNNNIIATIRHVVNHIQPDRIVVTPAANAGMYNTGADSNDVENVRDLLRTLSPDARVETAEPSTFAAFHWEAGTPVFNTRPHDHIYDVDDEETPPDLRMTMSPLPRRLGGNVLYYGGDGETRGVLDQNAAPVTGGPAISSGSRRDRGSRRARVRKSIRERCIIM